MLTSLANLIASMPGYPAGSDWGVSMIFRAGMFTALAALLCSTSAYAQSAPWTISEASGRVVIRDGAGDHAGARGATVPAGATVMTGATGRAILVRGQDFVTLSANARMRLPGAAQAGGLFQMIQEWGNALFRIEHRKDRREREGRHQHILHAQVA